MMSLPLNKPTRKRVNLSLTPDLYCELVALSAVKGKEPAKFAREILADYFSKHAEEISEAKKAGEAYQKNIAEIRRMSSSPKQCEASKTN